jgi:uncharacterized OB-fold protein
VAPVAAQAAAGGIVQDPHFRVLPALDAANEFFWTSGKDGVLRFLRCAECDELVHPPAPYCPKCGSDRPEPTAVSGRGMLYSFTVNHQAWDGTTEPYVIGLVAIDEQPAVRLTTNIVGCEPDAVTIGMPVEVVFADHDPIYLPLFAPVGVEGLE